ncbi:MAG: hypothetical protein ABII90_01760 [Bacteroidota bacterium]
MAKYIVTGIAVTGTPGSPQTINYGDLVDIDGNAVPATLSGTVSIDIIYKSKDTDVYVTEIAGATSFKIARSNIGDISAGLTIGVVIESIVSSAELTYQTYKVLNVSITGTPASPQTINYSDLTPEDGAVFPSAFDSNPTIRVIYKNKDCGVGFPAIAGLSSFTVYRSNYGDISGSLIVGLEISGGVIAALGNQLPLQYMIDLMGIYIEDIYHERAKRPLKCQILNFAQYYLLNRIMDKEAYHLIPSLVEYQANLTLTSATYALSSLAYSIYNNANGITLLKVTGATGKPIIRISRSEYATLLMNNYTFYNDKPLYYDYNNILYILPTTLGQNIDIYYVRKPQKMSLGATVEQNIDCEIEAEFHEMIVGLACKQFIDVPSARIAYESAVALLDSMIENTRRSDLTKFPQYFNPVIDVGNYGSRFNILRGY